MKTIHTALLPLLLLALAPACGKAEAPPTPSVPAAPSANAPATPEPPSTPEPPAADDHGHDHDHDHPATPPPAPAADATKPPGFDSPRAAAAAGLAAFKAQSVADLLASFPPTGMINNDIPKASVFKPGDWTVTSTERWGGGLGALRIDGQDGRVQYAKDGGEILTAGVFNRDGRWFFRKLFRMAEADWAAWGKLAAPSAQLGSQRLRPSNAAKGVPTACVAKCVANQQMRAVGPEVIQRDCEKLCAARVPLKPKAPAPATP